MGSAVVAFLKLHYTESPEGSRVVARVMSGVSREDAVYSGTLVLPPDLFEQFLDALVFGASRMMFDTGKLEVYFAPDTDLVADE